MRWFAAAALAALLLVGCGESRQARGLVRDFMGRDMGLADAEVLEWSKMDSTFFVTDSVVQVMRVRAAAVGQLRAHGHAAYVAPTPKLHFIHVRYVAGGDTLRQTFYLDAGLTGVVGFKND